MAGRSVHAQEGIITLVVEEFREIINMLPEQRQREEGKNDGNDDGKK
jgi:hypothetical protein